MPGIHMFCSLKKVRLRDSVYVKLKVGRGTCEIIFRTDLIPQQFMKLEVLTAIISRLVVIKGNNTGTNIFSSINSTLAICQLRKLSILAFLIDSAERI